MSIEPRVDLIPMVMMERHRQICEQPDNELDLLLLHPIDAQDLYHEISHKMPWADSPPASEVKYQQFYGMDILVSPLMTHGFFVVGKRRPIKVWAVEGQPYVEAKP